MKKIKEVCLLLTILLSITTISFSHSGRTDSNGGHHDYSNSSGLGSYHYHHGYSAHLHPNGVCPYETTSTSMTTEQQEETYTITKDDDYEISQLNSKIEELQSQINYKEESIEELNNELDEKNSKIKRLNDNITALFIGFIFILSLCVYIAYNVGLNKK